MGDARHARWIVRRLWPRFGGALLTVCAAILLELLSGTMLRVPTTATACLRLLRPGVVVTNQELQLRRTDGTSRWGLVHLREVADGASTYLEGIVIDITERKIAELGLELHEVGGAT